MYIKNKSYNTSYLLWCVYKPVTWPCPVQPGVGHLLFSEIDGNGKEENDK